jgi:hypothetical protein
MITSSTWPAPLLIPAATDRTVRLYESAVLSITIFVLREKSTDEGTPYDLERSAAC